MEDKDGGKESEEREEPARCSPHSLPQVMYCSERQKSNLKAFFAFGKKALFALCI